MTTSGNGLASALVCAGCGASPARDDPHPFQCPNAGANDDTDHVLRRRLDVSAVDFPLRDCIAALGYDTDLLPRE